MTNLEGSRALGELNEEEQEQLCRDTSGRDLLGATTRCDIEGVIEVLDDGGGLAACQADRGMCLANAPNRSDVICGDEPAMFDASCTATVDDWVDCQLAKAQATRQAFAGFRCENLDELDDARLSQSIASFNAAIEGGACQPLRDLCGFN